MTAAEEAAHNILKASNAGVLVGSDILLQHWAVRVARAFLALDEPATVPLTPQELEEAIKHVTAYDDCQVGMLDYTKLWRLVVAARQYVWMLQRCENLYAALKATEGHAPVSATEGSHK